MAYQVSCYAELVSEDVNPMAISNKFFYTWPGIEGSIVLHKKMFPLVLDIEHQLDGVVSVMLKTLTENETKCSHTAWGRFLYGWERVVL